MSLQKYVTNADEWYVSNLLSVNTTKSVVTSTLPCDTLV